VEGGVSARGEVHGRQPGAPRAGVAGSLLQRSFPTTSGKGWPNAAFTGCSAGPCSVHHVRSTPASKLTLGDNIPPCRASRATAGLDDLRARRRQHSVGQEHPDATDAFPILRHRRQFRVRKIHRGLGNKHQFRSRFLGGPPSTVTPATGLFNCGFPKFDPAAPETALRASFRFQTVFHAGTNDPFNPHDPSRTPRPTPTNIHSRRPTTRIPGLDVDEPPSPTGRLFRAAHLRGVGRGQGKRIPSSGRLALRRHLRGSQ